MPADVELPPIYLLGSSGYSAELAATIGAGFAFAHHFATYDAVDAMTSYRNRFRPSAALDAAACDPRRRRGLRRQRRRGRPPRHHHRSQFPAPLQGRVSAAGEPRGGRGLSLFRGRPRAHPPKSRARLHRHRRDAAHAARSAARSDQGRRGDGDDDDLRPRGAAALVRVAGAGVRARRRARAGTCRIVRALRDGFVRALRRGRLRSRPGREYRRPPLLRHDRLMEVSRGQHDHTHRFGWIQARRLSRRPARKAEGRPGGDPGDFRRQPPHPRRVRPLRGAGLCRGRAGRVRPHRAQLRMRLHAGRGRARPHLHSRRSTGRR